MEASTLRTGRWIVGGVVFLAAATILFEAAGQSSPRPAAVRPNTYRPVPTDDREVRTALNFALADQNKKNRSNSAIILRNVLTAERQASKGDNFRMCLSSTAAAVAIPPAPSSIATRNSSGRLRYGRGGRVGSPETSI